MTNQHRSNALVNILEECMDVLRAYSQREKPGVNTGLLLDDEKQLTRDGPYYKDVLNNYTFIESQINGLEDSEYKKRLAKEYLDLQIKCEEVHRSELQ